MYSQMIKCLILILVVNYVQTEYSCEKVNENLLKPCYCIGASEFGLSLICSNVTKWSIVKKALNTLTIRRIENLEIEDLNEDKFTEDVFKNYHILSLKFKNCSFIEFKQDALLSLNGTIKSLSLNCKLSKLPIELFSSLYNLTRLDLSTNNLQKITAKSFVSLPTLKNLTELLLDSNQIEKLEADAFYSLDNLEKLSLSRNNLSKIDKNALRNLKKLIYFDLSFNQFKDIDKKDISDFTSLLHLNYSDNQIAKLPRSIFVRNSQLRTL